MIALLGSVRSLSLNCMELDSDTTRTRLGTFDPYEETWQF